MLFRSASHSVIIGGWRNTRSAIQKGAESVSYNVTPSAQVPGDDQFHPYWISVDGTTISYGKGAVPNMNMIGTWTSPDTLNISQFSLSSYSNVTEYRNIKVVELDDPTAHKVEANTNGQFTIWKPKWKLPETGRGAVTFKAVAEQDIIIGFTDSLEGQAVKYRISVGTWDNSISAIYKDSKQVVRSESPATLVRNDGQANDYWFAFDKGRIKIGRAHV